MANINATVDVKLSDLGLIKDLLMVMAEEFDSLPKMTAECLIAIVEDGAIEIDREELSRRGFGSVSSGGELDGLPVISANKVLRRVTVGGMRGAVSYKYPEHYRMQCGEAVVMEW